MKTLTKLLTGASVLALASSVIVPSFGATAPKGAKYDHVLVISVDGLHAVDLANYVSSHPTSALATLAMIKTGQFNASVNQAMAHLVKTKQSGGTWGTTQATILALKALLAGMGGSELKDDIHFTIKVNGEVATRGKIGKADADVMQAFDLKGFKAIGANEVQIEVNGETNLMYQIVNIVATLSPILT